MGNNMVNNINSSLPFNKDSFEDLKLFQHQSLILQESYDLFLVSVIKTNRIKIIRDYINEVNISE